MIQVRVGNTVNAVSPNPSSGPVYAHTVPWGHVLLGPADYGFADDERFAFLETEDGLVFFRDAYGSIDDATTLDEVEDHIKAMLESSGSQEAK